MKTVKFDVQKDGSAVILLNQFKDIINVKKVAYYAIKPDLKNLTLKVKFYDKNKRLIKTKTKS